MSGPVYTFGSVAIAHTCSTLGAGALFTMEQLPSAPIATTTLMQIQTPKYLLPSRRSSAKVSSQRRVELAEGRSSSVYVLVTAARIFQKGKTISAKGAKFMKTEMQMYM